ncbi:MAG TPA: oligosaccharide flippase family protein [Kofleriaceae bacterium]|nr:oligosaccharide flippase family protein [Kofleriaceae bacterium]
MASGATSPGGDGARRARGAGGGASSEAARAGRGVIYIAFAKFYFMVAGFVLEIGLRATLGTTTYGAYGVVNSLVSPFNNVLVTGTIQAVSRFGSQRPEAAAAVQRAGLRMHLFVGLALAVAFAAMAPVTASLFHDQAKTGPIMLAALIVAAYSFYSVFVGTANGRREFHKQAGLDIGAATTRMICILGLAAAGFGLYGAIGGWAAAAIIMLLVSTVVVGLPRRGAGAGHPTQDLRPMVGFFIGVSVYLILLNFIMVADQLLLKRLSAEWYAASGADALAALRPHAPAWLMARLGAIDPAHAADGQVGYYRAVQTLARISYQAIIAATFVVFPLVSRSTFENDRGATARYIRTTVRYSLIFATGIAIVMAANPVHILSIPFQPDDAAFGAPALVALALGNVAFSVFAIAGTILNGAGMTRHAIAVALLTLVAAAAANLIVIPMFTPGRSLLLACGAATAGAMVLGAAAGGFVLHRQLGAFLPPVSLVRVALAAAAAVAVGRVIPLSSAIGTIAESVVVGAVFLVALIVTRELGPADLSALTRVVRKKGGGAA